MKMNYDCVLINVTCVINYDVAKEYIMTSQFVNNYCLPEIIILQIYQVLKSQKKFYSKFYILYLRFIIS